MDHIVNFIGIDLVSRLGHSLIFPLIIMIILIIVNKRDYLLGAIGFGAIFSHISFDILFKGSDTFPLFAPFNNDVIYFQNFDWIIFQIFAFLLILLVNVINKNKTKEIQA